MRSLLGSVCVAAMLLGPANAMEELTFTESDEDALRVSTTFGPAEVEVSRVAPGGWKVFLTPSVAIDGFPVASWRESNTQFVDRVQAIGPQELNVSLEDGLDSLVLPFPEGTEQAFGTINIDGE